MKKIIWPIFFLVSIACTSDSSEKKGIEDKGKDKIMDKNQVEWQWDDEKIAGQAEADAYRYVFAFDEELNTARVIQKDTKDQESRIWERQDAIINSADLWIEDDRLYIGLFARTFTGGSVLALDLSTKELVWETKLKGLGSIGHSRNITKVQLKMIDKQLFVFGWESGGKYIETLNPETGESTSNIILKE